MDTPLQQASTGGARVLVVDDEPVTARGYARLLTLAGYHVETANNGKEAAERTRAISYDAIVSDITMPEMSGLAFLRSVREVAAQC